MPVQILIVEDQPITATDLEETLLNAGYGISGIARTYAEATEIARHKTVDVALVDVHLATAPDGIATARELLRIRHIPIIYLTNNTDKKTVERAKTTFPAAYLTKPFRSADVLIQIELAIQHVQRDQVGQPEAMPGELMLPFKNGLVRVALADICALEAAGNYTNVYLTASAQHRIFPGVSTEKSLLVTANLGLLSPYLPPHTFHKLSRSAFINLNCIERIEQQLVYMGRQQFSIPESGKRTLMARLTVIRSR